MNLAILNKQVNDAPEPLKSYIHEMDFGPSADLLQEKFAWQWKYEELSNLVERKNNGSKMPHVRRSFFSALELWIHAQVSCMRRGLQNRRLMR